MQFMTSFGPFIGKLSVNTNFIESFPAKINTQIMKSCLSSIVRCLHICNRNGYIRHKNKAFRRTLNDILPFIFVIIGISNFPIHVYNENNYNIVLDYYIKIVCLCLTKYFTLKYS